LAESDAPQAISAAFAWLTKHGESIEAQFILASLLGRTDLAENDATQAVSAAICWLNKYYDTQHAEFVLKNILGKSLLSNDQKAECFRLAVRRLEAMYRSPDANFLLKHCLKDKALVGEARRKVVACAVLWLRANAVAGEMDFVFNRLLRYPDVSDAVWREVADIAFAWLKRTPLALDRDRTLNSLMARLGIIASEEKEYLKAEAEEWLKAFPEAKDKERLLTCLKRMQDGMNSLSLSNILRRHAESGTLPERELFTQGLDTAQSMLANNRPGCAGFYLVPLLPLAARLGDDDFRCGVYDVTTRLLKHPKLAAAQKYGFSRESYKLLHNGAWQDRVEGRKILVSLGIEE
jgi:hypothetical protein